MAYEVRIAPAAERAIRKLLARTQVAILDRLDQLADEPRPPDCEKVKALAQYDVFRVKVEKDYRILYQVKDDVAWVLVVKIADRKEVYRRLDDMRRLLR